MNKKMAMKKMTIREVETVKTTAADYDPCQCPVHALLSWLFG